MGGTGWVSVDTWDTVFVRAGRRAVHEVVREPRTWGGWWPGVRSGPARGEPGATVVVLRPPLLVARAVGRRQLLTVRVVEDRPGLGVALAYRGTVTGEAEWFYLDEPAGCLVHYLVRARVPRHGWRRTVAEHRAAARAALLAVKDGLEGARRPGDEPPSALLAAQRVAQAEFRAGVEAWARRARIEPDS